MIFWIASYPRSGNTLLRTILKQTMGLGAFSDVPNIPDLGLKDEGYENLDRLMDDEAKDITGYLPMTESWESFYEKAMARKKTNLVKTHLPPRDDQPVILIVRDGRRSLVSYFKYHQTILTETSLSLSALVLGADFYGGWSEHYKNWVSNKRKTLLIRFEDLLEPTPELLQSIARFVGYDGPISDWSNPFDHLQERSPYMFAAGEVKWKGEPEWTELINGVFFLLHGDLMIELGYADRDGVDKARGSLSQDIIELVEAARSAFTKKASLENICRERLEVINVLDAEVKRLSPDKGN